MRRSRLIVILSDNFPSVDHNNYTRVVGDPLQTYYGIRRENFGCPSYASHYSYGNNSGYYGQTNMHTVVFPIMIFIIAMVIAINTMVRNLKCID